MASLRNIKVLSTLGESGEIETNVSTLGELKPLLAERGINYSGMKIMVGETRNELSMDDAVLPNDDFKLYLMPQKTKSGSLESIAAKAREISELLYDLAEDIDETIEEGDYAPAIKAASPSYDPDLADLQRVAESWK